jgi:hypothetical protein
VPILPARGAWRRLRLRRRLRIRTVAAQGREVDGVVTATQGGTTGRAARGMVLGDGARLVATSTGTVTVQGAGGCSVRIPPAHGFTVTPGMDCQRLKAAWPP